MPRKRLLASRMLLTQSLLLSSEKAEHHMIRTPVREDADVERCGMDVASRSRLYDCADVVVPCH